MSRPTTVRHPLATLRQAIDLGRQQLSRRLGLSRPALEKIERGRNPFGAALRDRAFVATGVCPGWLAHERGPIHTADGYPMTREEFTRWDTWRSLAGKAGADAPLAAMGGRVLGPCYRRDCCVGAARLLAHGPLGVPAGQALAARRFQAAMERDLHRRLGAHLVDRARGVAHWSLAHWDQAEKPLWELLAALDRLFPDAPALPDPTDEAALAHLMLPGPLASRRGGRRGPAPE